MNTDKITLTLTPEEAKWLRDSLSVASSAFAEAKAEAMRKWTMQFAKGLMRRCLDGRQSLSLDRRATKQTKQPGSIRKGRPFGFCPH
jgi:hypothetical protein